MGEVKSGLVFRPLPIPQSDLDFMAWHLELQSMVTGLALPGKVLGSAGSGLGAERLLFYNAERRTQQKIDSRT